jgi:hypothetical protein
MAVLKANTRPKITQHHRGVIRHLERIRGIMGEHHTRSHNINILDRATKFIQNHYANKGVNLKLSLLPNHSLKGRIRGLIRIFKEMI